MKKKEMTPLPAHSLGILLLVAIGLVISSIDIYAPAMPMIKNALGTSDQMIQTTILLSPLMSLFFEVPLGYLSDYQGRRKLFLFSLFLFILGSLATSLCFDIYHFMLARSIQASGGAGVIVLGFSMGSDIFKGVNMSRFVSTFSMVNPIILGLAPIIGAYIQTYLGWRSIFLVTATAALILFGVFFFRLHETHPQESRSLKGGFFHFWKKSWHVLKTPTLGLLFLAHALPIGMSLAWRTSGPFIFIEGFGLSPEFFAILMAVTISFSLLAGVFNNYFLAKAGLDNSLKLGAFLLWIFVILAICSFHDQIPSTPLSIVGVMSVFSMGIVILSPGAASRGIMSASYNRGLVIALFSLFRNLALVSFVFISSYFSNDTIYPLYLIMIPGTIICLICASFALMKPVPEHKHT